MNPETIGYVWTGEFDLNTLRVDGEIFESGKKKLQIQNYPDTSGRGLKLLQTSLNKKRNAGYDVFSVSLSFAKKC